MDDAPQLLISHLSSPPALSSRIASSSHSPARIINLPFVSHIFAKTNMAFSTHPAYTIAFIAMVWYLLLLSLATCTAEISSTRKTLRIRGTATTLRQAQHDRASRKVHAYILVGQSNMEGHGEIDKRDDNGLLLNGTLLYQLHDPRTRDEFQILWNEETNTWKSLPNVQIWYQEAGYEEGVNGTNIPGVNGQDYSAGDLTVGYGAGGTAAGRFFGPELGFGFHLKLPPGASPNDKILLIKTAWGGKCTGICRTYSSTICTVLV